MENLLLIFVVLLAIGGGIGLIRLVRKPRVRVKKRTITPRPSVMPAPQPFIINDDDYYPVNRNGRRYPKKIHIEETKEDDNTLINTIIAAEVISDIFSNDNISPSMDDSPSFDSPSSDNSSFDFGGGDFGGGGAGGDF